MLTRRAVLGGLVLGASGCFRLARQGDAEAPLSDVARRMWNRSWADVDARQVLDTHVHVVGLGKDGTGCYVNPHLQSYAHPILAARFSIYKTAAGVQDEAHADAEYLAALTKRAGGPLVHGRHLILAFDQAHDEAGQPMPAASEFYTPNRYVEGIAAARPDVFVACASIHPYRADCVDELERSVAAGAVAVKWLPNAMRMDPGSPKCDRFYDALARLQVPLLTHAGEEKAVEAEDAQRFGNPLLLRRPLERGVRVIVAHCASLGQNPDLDVPGDQKPWVDNFDLFARLMDEEKWNGRLFGEVSAMCQANRAGRALEEVLRRTEWHPRLLNGSDYPLPAINVVVQTRVLKDRGFITAVERKALNELDRHNPLVFDWVLKRTIRLERDGVVYKLSPEIFTHRDVFPRLKAWGAAT